MRGITNKEGVFYEKDFSKNGKDNAVISYRAENNEITYIININGSFSALKTNKANFVKMIMNFNF